MLFTFKALLLSSALLTQGDLSLQDRAAMILGQDSPQTIQDENYKKAVKLMSQSSMALDAKHSEQLLQEACKLGYGRACWYYAVDTDDEKDILHAKEVLTNSCFSGETYQNGESCTYLGIMASHDVGGISQKERELYERACRLNDGWGCYRLAYDFMSDEDSIKKSVEKALDILTKSCENGNASSCYFAGSIYMDPNPNVSNWIVDSADKAQYYYKKGCDLGDGDSCGNIYDEEE